MCTHLDKGSRVVSSVWLAAPFIPHNIIMLCCHSLHYLCACPNVNVYWGYWLIAVISGGWCCWCWQPATH